MIPLALLLLAPAPRSPVAWQVAPPKAVGATLKLTLQGRLDPGWHLYALEEAADGPIPTTITLAEGDPAELLQVTEAKPRTARDPAFNAPTRFFDATAAFHLRLVPAKTAPAPGAAVHILVRYQSCNGEVCLPPRTDTVAVPLSLKP